jgi:hypothetical protein
VGSEMCIRDSIYIVWRETIHGGMMQLQYNLKR